MIKLSLRNKLYIGFGILSAMIILLWIIGTYFIYNLSDRSAAMLKENYQSIESAEFLLKSFDEIENLQVESFYYENDTSFSTQIEREKLRFEENLQDLQSNVTEEGESDLINSISSQYRGYIVLSEVLISNNQKRGDDYFSNLIPKYRQLRDSIIELSNMNRKAIIKKNNFLNETSHNAFLVLSLIGLLCFLIAILFSYGYPKSVVKPIRQLTKAIEEIAKKNYAQELNLLSKDELGELARAFNTMAIKLKEYEDSNISELLFEKKRTETIINNLKDAIIGLNEKNEVIFSNVFASKLFGISENQILGKKVSDVVKENKLMNIILEEFGTEEFVEKSEFTSVKILDKGITSFYSKDILKVLLSTQEKNPIHAGYVIILKNVTKYLEQDEAKTNFIATISHQLKTPISSIRLHLKLLDDKRIGNLNQEQQEIVYALKNESNKMLNITSELLDLAQVETGNIQVNLKSVLPESIIENVRESILKQARMKDVTIEFVVEPELPAMIGDEEKTAWVLLNLVNNAIQYSESGSSVFVSVSLDGSFIKFSVKDFGRGIEEIYLEKVFEKYFRVPGSAESGTGLGLSISKEFIEKQHGKIWAESELHKGSAFYFRLPLK